MKIQCDVCGTSAASVFCAADEAALCPSCDHRVHHANKLASKHHRLALIHPSSPKDSPLCDICQEKRAFLFCQQDRAILCRDCDVPIHQNEHTKEHNRFLLTGVKLSAASSLHEESCSQSKLPPTLPIPNPTPSSSPSAAATKSTGSDKSGNDHSTNISDHLIEMLPGWHVHDLLEYPFGFHQNEDWMLPFTDSDVGGTIIGFTSDQSMGRFWVPRSPSPLYFPETSGQMMSKETREVGGTGSTKRSRTYLGDDLFAVPQISPPSSASKRSRPLW